MAEDKTTRMFTLDEAVSARGPSEAARRSVLRAKGEIPPAVRLPEWFPLEGPAPDMPDDVPEDALGVWTWFAGDVLSDDPGFSGWDFYGVEAWNRGWHYGGDMSAEATATQAEILEHTRRFLKRDDVHLAARTWQLRPNVGPYAATWTTVPAFIVTETRVGEYPVVQDQR